MPVKVIVELHEGDKTTRKIWRFDPGKAYTKEGVCKDVRMLFPHILEKGLQLDLHHMDELAGKIDIESDGD